MFEAMIFDMDGLLVDSDPLQYKAYNQAFSEFGHPLTEEDWNEWIHTSATPKEWIDSKKINLDPHQIRERKKEIYEEFILTQMELMPGARDLVNLLYSKFPLAVASGSRIESIELCMNKFNLSEKFDHLISSDDLKTGKPEPEVFLHTADKLNVNPRSCLVFEDSIAGLQAAKRAGMKCIICPNKFSNIDINEYKDADLIVNQLSEVTLLTIQSISET